MSGSLKSIVRRKARNTFLDIERIINDPRMPTAKRQAGLMPPMVRRNLARIGNDVVTSLSVVRTPVSSFVQGLMNVISLGEYQRAVRRSGYDQMFHLSLLINGMHVLDKQEVLKLVEGSPEGERESVSLPQTPITISQLMERTRQHMGDRAFTTYHPRTNNCQKLVSSVLEANGLMTNELSTFITQDADAVFKRMPRVTESLARFFTDVGSVSNKNVEGSNIQKMPSTSPWMLHVKATMAKHPDKKLKEVLKLASSTYAKKK